MITTICETRYLMPTHWDDRIWLQVIWRVRFCWLRQMSHESDRRDAALMLSLMRP